jgi:hypothetical protein
MPKIWKMRDATDGFTVKKQPLFDLPMRLMICGRTGAGKTNAVGSLLMRPHPIYKGDWKPENIYVVSGSLKGDAKLQTIIDQLDIPKSNLFGKYEEALVDAIYETVMDNYNKAIAEKRSPDHSVLLLDDVSYTGRLAAVNKKDDPLLRVLMNGRKYLCSVICTAQKYSQLATSARENASGMMLASCSNKQLDVIENDVNQLKTKKDFHEMFRRQTKDPHDYFVVDYGHPALYKDHDFQPLPDLAHAQR